MLVINRGLSGKYHILRGSDAAQFLYGLGVASWNPVVLRFQADHTEHGKFIVTEVGTAVLVLNPESISNPEAKLALDAAVRAHNKNREARHGSA